MQKPKAPLKKADRSINLSDSSLNQENNAGPMGFEPMTFSYLHTQQGVRRLTRYPYCATDPHGTLHNKMSNIILPIAPSKSQPKPHPKITFLPLLRASQGLKYIKENSITMSISTVTCEKVISHFHDTVGSTTERRENGKLEPHCLCDNPHLR